MKINSNFEEYEVKTPHIDLLLAELNKSPTRTVITFVTKQTQTPYLDKWLKEVETRENIASLYEELGISLNLGRVSPA